MRARQTATPLVRPRRLAERQEVHSARGGRQKGAVGRGLGWVGVLKSVEMLRSGRVRIVPVVRPRYPGGGQAHQGGVQGAL